MGSPLFSSRLSPSQRRQSTRALSRLRAMLKGPEHHAHNRFHVGGCLAWVRGNSFPFNKHHSQKARIKMAMPNDTINQSAEQQLTGTYSYGGSTYVITMTAQTDTWPPFAPFYKVVKDAGAPQVLTHAQTLALVTTLSPIPMSLASAGKTGFVRNQ